MKLREIARIAGVSATTASYALSGKGTIATDTRQRVRRIAKKFGYEPHGPAQALSTGYAPWIAVASAMLLGHSVGTTEGPILLGLGKVLSAEGIELVLLGEELRSGVPRMLAQRAVSGGVFLNRPHQILRTWLREHSIPSVGVNLGNVADMDTVFPDEDGGVRLALDHLAQLGHKHIAYVNTSLSPGAFHAPSVERRQRAFLKTMAERELYAVPGTELHRDIRERVHGLMTQASPPTALLCYSDDVGAIAIQALHELGLHVPRDVSVIGIDDAYVAKVTSPPMTSVRLPWTQMGKKAGELLLARLAEPDRPFESRELSEKLLVRKSTGPPSGQTPSPLHARRASAPKDRDLDQG